ncbi:hypothetical protein U1Q18_043664 [Sarracenia purpurea var. burkii]
MTRFSSEVFFQPNSGVGDFRWRRDPVKKAWFPNRRGEARFGSQRIWFFRKKKSTVKPYGDRRQTEAE